jgi:hypothetical protein
MEQRFKEPKKQGISFEILIKCLTHAFKVRLAREEVDLRLYIQLDSENAYKLLLYNIKKDVGYEAYAYKPKPGVLVSALRWLKNLLTGE